jgi:hypothetical protein
MFADHVPHPPMPECEEPAPVAPGLTLPARSQLIKFTFAKQSDPKAIASVFKPKNVLSALERINMTATALAVRGKKRPFSPERSAAWAKKMRSYELLADEDENGYAVNGKLLYDR